MTDNKLKDNEIIKALKCVPKDVSGYIIDENNKMKLVYNEDVIDLINRQQGEIEKLEISDASKEECTIKQHGKIKELKAEVERLKERNKILDLNRRMALLEKEPLYDKIKTAKAEAVKEFAERLKDSFFDNGYESPDIDFDYFVDNLVKEMVGDDNA